jgi:hypothetical protein
MVGRNGNPAYRGCDGDFSVWSIEPPFISEVEVDHSADCPNADALQRFMLGEVSDADREACEAHLAACRECSQRIERLPAEDSLVQAMRNGSPILAESQSPAYERII